MNFRSLSIASGVLGMAFGAAITLVQPFMTRVYGLPSEAANVAQARGFGGLLFVWGLIAFMMRDVDDRATQRLLLMANIVGYLIQIALTLHGIQSGVLNALSWSSVAIYAALMAASGVVMRSASVAAPHAGR